MFLAVHQQTVLKLNGSMWTDEGYGPTWDSDDEYDNFIRKMNPPRIVIDNDSCNDATIVRVDSANEYGILLEVIQVLTDLNLVISKAYITSDGGWFMDVFNITDKEGQKLNDKATLARIEDYICKSLGADSRYIPSRRRSVDVAASTDHTVIELTGTDRPGLLSEVSAVLASLRCNVVSAEIWTHDTRAAAVMRVTDEGTGLAVTDAVRLELIKERLSYLLRGGSLSRGAATAVSSGSSTTHTERRLHQMMLDDGDHDQLRRRLASRSQRPNVTVSNWSDKDYSVVTIRCKDRAKLLFDTVCTLTDLHYVVFHANIDAKDNQAYQEFYVRHANGSPINTEADRLRVIQCLEAAIERRVSEGVKLDLCTNDKVGLLSEVTRIFRENSLTVTRAEVSTRGRMAVNTFYVRDSAGGTVDQKTIDSIRQAIGQNIQVKGQPEPSEPQKKESPTWFLFANLFRPSSPGICMTAMAASNSVEGMQMQVSGQKHPTAILREALLIKTRCIKQEVQSILIMMHQKQISITGQSAFCNAVIHHISSDMQASVDDVAATLMLSSHCFAEAYRCGGAKFSWELEEQLNSESRNR
ncbi:hypothetical protein ABZP36_004890 [Zizania latifolia]